MRAPAPDAFRDRKLRDAHKFRWSRYRLFRSSVVHGHFVLNRTTLVVTYAVPEVLNLTRSKVRFERPAKGHLELELGNGFTRDVIHERFQSTRTKWSELVRVKSCRPTPPSSKLSPARVHPWSHLIDLLVFLICACSLATECRRSHSLLRTSLALV